jgi:uncharacterized protein YhdP
MSSPARRFPLPPGLIRGARVGARVLMWGLLAGASIVLGLWLVLQLVILPRLQTWRPELEQWTSQALGAPVQMQHIEVQGDLWAPVVVLHGLKVLDRQGATAFELARIQATLTPGSLLPRGWNLWQPHLRRVELQSPDLTVRRHRDGQLSIAGLTLASSKDDAGASKAAADWIFTQDEWRIQQGRVRWIDDLRAAPPLLLEAVDLDLRNTAGRHRLALTATPPAGWGQRFEVTADLRAPLLARLQHPGDWMRWRGDVQVKLPAVDVQTLREHAQLPFDLRRGQGRLDLDLQVDQGLLSGATAQVQLQSVALQLGRQLPELEVNRLQGQLALQQTPQSLQLKAHDLSFELQGRDGPPMNWAPSDLQLDLDGPAAAWTGGQLRASRLDLNTLASMATHLPFSRAMRQWITEAEPRGVLRAVQLQWEGPAEQPAHWQAQADADNLAINASAHSGSSAEHPLPGRPGVRGAQLRIKADDTGGTARLTLKQGELDFPGVFEDTRVPMHTLDADLRWSVTPADPRSLAERLKDRLTRRQPEPASAAAPAPQLKVEVLRASFSNADTRGELSGSWQTGDGAKVERLPGRLDLEVRLEQAQASRVHRYLPIGIPAAIRHYVRDGMLSGSAHKIKARVHGPIQDFPWHQNPAGEFHIEAQVQDLVYDVAPEPIAHGHPWPHLTHLNGELVFEGQSMQIRQASARLGHTGSGEFELQQVQARIGDFVHDAVLHIQGQGQGPLNDGLRYVSTSPVGGWLQHSLDEATGTGTARLKLNLALPLTDIDRSTAQGQLELTGNTLQIRADVPRLDNAHGRLNFSEQGFHLEDANATGLGGPVTLSGGSRPDGSVHLHASGTATAAGLRDTPQIALLPSLARFMSGQSNYELDLGFTHNGLDLLLSSPLTGMAFQAPAPLGKAAATALPLRVMIQPLPRQAPQAPRELLRVDAGTVLSTQFVRENSGERVLRGLVLVGANATASGRPLPAEGTQAVIDLPQADLQEWQNWHDQAEVAGLVGADTAPTDASYQPRDIRFRAGQLQVGGRRFTQVQAQLRQDPRADAQVWLGSVQADQFAGQVELQQPHDSRRPKSLRARLSHLNLPDDSGEGNAAASPLPSSTPAQRLPGIDLVVEQFSLDDLALGRLELDAGHAAGDGGRGAWLINRLSLSNADAAWQASGRWTPSVGHGQDSMTALDFQLAVHDGGALLARLGNGGAMRGGKGKLGGKVDWHGSPAQFNAASLSGQIRVDLEAGQFLHAEPGVARLLGVLSLQSLPRRLLFDFRDIFAQGFSFDRIDGNVNILSGMARTRNLRIRGVQAMVLTEGQADLALETQDLHVWVVPDINAGAASLAYAVINPAIGLGTLVGQMFLRKPLTEAATREFRVTGRWEAPQVAALTHRTQLPADPGGESSTIDLALPSQATSGLGNANPPGENSQPRPR